jgi:plasmid stabilization system protein ParE
MEDIVDYISERNPKAAAGVVRKIMKRVDLLTTTPHMGKRFGQVEGEEVRFVVSGMYKVFYTVKDNIVEILSVWHGARRDPDLN